MVFGKIMNKCFCITRMVCKTHSYFIIKDLITYTRKISTIGLFVAISALWPTICVSAQKTEADYYYPLDGNAREISQSRFNGNVAHVKPVAGHNQQKNSALQFETISQNVFGNLSLPVCISPDSMPLVSITFWVKANETFKKIVPFSTGTNGRALTTDYYNGAQRWSVTAGKDGLVQGPPLLKDQWTFIALIYDNPNQQVRLIVNNEVYAGRARLLHSDCKTLVGSFNGAIDELRIYKRVLSLNELEVLLGDSITVNAGNYPITDRSSYRNKMEERRKVKIKSGDLLLVGYNELLIRDSVHSPNVQAVFAEGDTVKVLEAKADEWFMVENQSGKRGFVSGHTLESNCYKAGQNKFIFRFLNWLSQLFMLNRMANWLVVAIFTVVLIMAIRSRESLNQWFSRFGHADNHRGFGSRSQGTSMANARSALAGYFPVLKVKWWMIAPGLLFGLMLIAGSLWDAPEMQWYFSEGISIVPRNLTLPIHWALWLSMTGILLLTISLMVESIYIAGYMAGLLRILMLMLLNAMAVVVAFYLSIGFFLVIAGFILFLILALVLLSRRRY